MRSTGFLFEEVKCTKESALVGTDAFANIVSEGYFFVRVGVINNYLDFIKNLTYPINL